jgi:predicted GNAT superfamily acetyltransferase
MSRIRIAKTEDDIARCFPVMVQLRPHLRQETFVQRVRRQQAAFDYTLAMVEEEGQPVSLAGFRISECLFYGKYLYVDDLVTDSSSRSKGHGKTMLDWLVQHAQACSASTLTGSISSTG